MLNRREFVSGTTIAFLLVPLAACSSGGGATPGSASDCSGLSATSSVALGHTHTVCVLETDLTSRPAAGVTYTTSLPDPMHTIFLTAAQLSMINGGQSVTVTTSTNGNHNHQFVLIRMDQIVGYCEDPGNSRIRSPTAPGFASSRACGTRRRRIHTGRGSSSGSPFPHPPQTRSRPRRSGCPPRQPFRRAGLARPTPNIRAVGGSAVVLCHAEPWVGPDCEPGLGRRNDRCRAACGDGRRQRRVRRRSTAIDCHGTPVLEVDDR
jgi:hypothetical protein